MLPVNYIMLVHTLIDIQEIAQFKIKIKDHIPPRELRILLHIFFDFCCKTHTGENEIRNAFVNLISFALSLIFQHQLIAFTQFFLNGRVSWLHNFPHRKNILFDKGGTIHLPSTFHKIVCLIHQKDIITLDAICEKTL